MESEIVYLFSFSSYRRFRALLLCFSQHFRISRSFAYCFSRSKAQIWTPQADVYMYSKFGYFSSLFKFFDHPTPTRFPQKPPLERIFRVFGRFLISFRVWSSVSLYSVTFS